NLKIAGEIRYANATMDGYFSTFIPPPPSLGKPWGVQVEESALSYPRLGIGSELLCRAARFLHDGGVHSLDAEAKENAGLFYVFNGFRVNKSLYEEIVAEFLEEMTRQGVTIPETQVRTRLLDREANLAELAAFKVEERGVARSVGR